MKQTLDFPHTLELTRAVNVEMEPGDGTRYSFVVTLTNNRHDWAPDARSVASGCRCAGCMSGGSRPWTELLRQASGTIS